MTAPQDPFSTPPQGEPGSQPPTSQPPGYGAPAGGYGAAEGQPSGYGAPAYGQPPFGAPGYVTPRNGFGVTALVLGILALLTSLFFGGLLFGIPAIIFGALGRGRARRREASNGGMSVAGLVLGIISLLISSAVIAFGVSILNSDSGQDYQDCLREAGDDQAAIEQCAVDFSEDLTR